MYLYDVMRTTFAAREFTSQKVSDEVLFRILDNARFAPSGGNRQGWHVIVIRDRGIRAELGKFIVPVVKQYRAQVRAGESPFNTIIRSEVSQDDIERETLPIGFVEQFTEAPLLLLVLVDLQVVAAMDSELERIGVISGASIYPFVWNILLAARNEGLGGTLTTFLTRNEPRVKSLLAIPESYAVAALLPIGKPKKQLTKLRRRPVDTFVSLDRFDGAALFDSTQQ